jgi:NRAMP (natural resistance-associated macrophage protein)-like metal ion transporter
MKQEPGKSAPSRTIWRQLGPGLITGASDDDPSGIATYSQAGAAFGLNTLWTSWLTFPLMASMQEMCARIGLVTSSGLTGILKRHYPRPLLYVMILFSFPAITLNIGADIAGMGAVANLLFPSVHPAVFSVLFTVLLLFIIIYLPYRKLAAIMKWLCLGLLSYLIVPFLIGLEWGKVAEATFVPDLSFDRSYLLILVGVLGTTISPYMFFWQTSMEVEEKEESRLVVDKKLLSEMRTDVDFGMFFSCLVMFFIMLSTGALLHPAGLTEIRTVDEAASALLPLAGSSAYLLFAIGILGTGFLAVPVLAGSLSYITSETFGWTEGLNKKFHEAKGFYIVMIFSVAVALLINFVGISPVQSLLYTAVLYGLTSPVMIAIILHICNNRKIMGDFTNGRRSNLLGAITLLLMTVAAVSLISVTLFF